MAWNMDMFEAAGIDESQETWSYGAEFLETARQLTNADACEWGTLTTGGNDIHIWFPMAWGMGAKQLINADATEPTLFDDCGDKGLQQDVAFVLSDQVVPPVADARELAGEFGNLFQASKVGMWLRRSDGTGKGARLCLSQAPHSVISRTLPVAWGTTGRAPRHTERD